MMYVCDVSDVCETALCVLVGAFVSRRDRAKNVRKLWGFEAEEGLKHKSACVVTVELCCG